MNTKKPWLTIYPPADCDYGVAKIECGRDWCTLTRKDGSIDRRPLEIVDADRVKNRHKARCPLEHNSKPEIATPASSTNQLTMKL